MEHTKRSFQLLSIPPDLCSVTNKPIKTPGSFLHPEESNIPKSEQPNVTSCDTLTASCSSRSNLAVCSKRTCPIAASHPAKQTSGAMPKNFSTEYLSWRVSPNAHDSHAEQFQRAPAPEMSRSVHSLKHRVTQLHLIVTDFVVNSP